MEAYTKYTAIPPFAQGPGESEAATGRILFQHGAHLGSDFIKIVEFLARLVGELSILCHPRQA